MYGNFAGDGVKYVKKILIEIWLFLTNNAEFIQKDAKGHNMYGAAFTNFYKFAKNTGAFFASSIKSMDIQVPKPKQTTATTVYWNRNQILISQALDGANHLCEHDNKHKTFIAKSSGKEYMEGHHLIPLKFQNQFSCGIDVYANIICLCPICHRLMHYGTDTEKMYVAEKLFDDRKNRLISSGIDISKNEFIKFVI